MKEYLGTDGIENVLGTKKENLSLAPNRKERHRGRIYLIQVQQKAINESPNDALASDGLDLLLHCRNLRITSRNDRSTERHRPLLIQVVMRGVVVRDMHDALDGMQEGAYAQPCDHRRCSDLVLAERRVNR
jgi:hypothetical protein